MPTIDAHQHFWDTRHDDYGWLTPSCGALYRDFVPESLEPLLQECGVDATVLVQAAPSVAETRRLLAIAQRSSFVAGVVGWAPLDAPEGSEIVEQLSLEPLLVGVRPMIQDIADPDWMLHPAVGDSLRVMVAHRLCFDALVLQCHLPKLTFLLDQHPDLRIVIDHAAKPRVRDGTAWDGYARWKGDMTRLAAETGALCKLSGLVTEATVDWTTDDLRPFVDLLLDAFGPDRLMWGSDWPVLTTHAAYNRWHDVAHELMSSLSPRERSLICGENAIRFYGLELEQPA